MRPIWKGAISFGLVTIPVRVFLATEEKSLRFHQLHEKDKGRIRYKRVCAVDGEEAPFDEIVRGYEYEKDHYVVFDEDELDRGIPQARTIDIQKFVPIDEIDPLYWQRSYYLVPEGPGLKAYALLRRALKDERRVALAKFAFRDKEHLATLRVHDDVFVLETMFWPDEIREPAFEELDEDVEVRPQELTMAKSLIDNMTGKFDPTEFRDQYRERLEELVEKKIAGEEIAVVEEAPKAKVVDLIEALRQSVEQTGGVQEGKPSAKKRAGSKKRASGE